MSASLARHRVALAIALAGVAVSGLALVIHRRLAAAAGYTSFCNLGGTVNCDAVLGSPYGEAFGVPVAAWAVLAFAAGAALALPGALGVAAGGLADLGLLGLASASLGVALVMAYLSFAVLGHLCLLRVGLYVIIVAWLVTVLPLAARFDASPGGGWWRRPTAARAIAAAGLVVAVAAGALAARRPGGVGSVAEVRTRDARFYGWYTSLPVRPLSELTSSGCHRRGPVSAAVAIVEFSDFQCPFCVQAFRDLRDLMRARADVSLVFRHFPLDTACNPHVRRSLHPDACLAACAAECAGMQGRFWEYHDVLFENHERLDRGSLLRYARELRLDLPAFRACLDDPATSGRVGEDVTAGVRAGVASTPTVFFNGRAVEGAMDRAHYDYAFIIEKHAHDAHAPDGAS
jgi:protein-disulfide isomerase/uncharacterized membrane protein